MADEDDEFLVATSYDQFFAIDKRIHKVQDLHIPTRAGLGVNQIAVFFVALIFTFLFQVLILGQLMSILGIPIHWVFFVTVVFGPPVFCAWRVTRPMPYAKTIPGTVISLYRYYCDDPVHRRGLPVKSPSRPPEDFVQHYLRDWTVNAEFADEVPGEGDWTDLATEEHYARCTGTVDLQTWMDDKAIAHFTAEQDAKASDTGTTIQIHDRRGAVATVE